MTTNSSAVGATTQSRPKRRRSRTTTKKSAITATVIGLIGALGPALIAVLPDMLDRPSNIPTTPTPIVETQRSERVSIDDAKLSDSHTALALWGSASSFVEAVRVEIGAPNAKAPLVTAETDVTDGKWNVVATSDQLIPKPFEVKAFYRERPLTSSGIMKSARITVKLDPPSPAPTPQPGQDSGCPADSIPGCGTEPGWGPPAVYRSE
ncbi:hypothetical protein [Mycolicibacterium houstonense]|uniref:hypothetical protein n=1 Tax=Mycolicibacterium houstonense TaxID=146021 RepID=UPI0008345E36|nr:hypothetical protein [Mycolicibacterium houstonense]